MNANRETLVTIFGGSGFVGRHVVRALAKQDFRIRVAVRRPHLAGHLQPLGKVGQINAVQANLRYADSVAAAVRDADIVVNLVGILAPSGAQKFAAVQAEGAARVAEAASAAGARLIHVSAIGADPHSRSAYARTKAEGERAARAAVPSSVILRPSIIFGPEDDFFNRFASLAMMAPALPLIGGGKTKLQPVFVGDVAAAIAAAVEGRAQPGATYELGGPDIVSFREALELMLKVIDRKRLLVPLPFALAKMLALVLRFAPGALKLTGDQVELLKRDNIVSDEARAAGLTFDAFGIRPQAMEAIIPSYLWRFRVAGEFHRSAA